MREDHVTPYPCLSFLSFSHSISFYKAICSARDYWTGTDSFIVVCFHNCQEKFGYCLFHEFVVLLTQSAPLQNSKRSLLLLCPHKVQYSAIQNVSDICKYTNNSSVFRALLSADSIVMTCMTTLLLTEIIQRIREHYWSTRRCTRRNAVFTRQLISFISKNFIVFRPLFESSQAKASFSLNKVRRESFLSEK